MLADRFALALDALQAANARSLAARNARDALIAVSFPQLDAAFSAMIDTATGTHPMLAITKTTVTDTFTNRGFATLDKTVTHIESTFYGVPEAITFTPQLESIVRDQFGAIHVTTSGFAITPTPQMLPSPLDQILAMGVFMFDPKTPVLGIPLPAGYEKLTAPLLEQFLALLFLRT
jgi:hypothetical protein